MVTDVSLFHRNRLKYNFVETFDDVYWKMHGEKGPIWRESSVSRSFIHMSLEFLSEPGRGSFIRTFERQMKDGVEMDHLFY
jgi:hypothetical protein